MKKAFTLIELIFAIVVMSIVMLSFPIIMQVDSDARERAFAQEAVLAASAKMAQLMTYQWDENSTDWNDLAENIQTSARLLDGTNHSTNAFNRVAGTQSRAGGGHRQFFPTAKTPSDVLVDNNWSVNGLNQELVVGLDEQNLSFGVHSGFDTTTTTYVTDSYGYKRNYQMAVDIRRINDALRIGGGGLDVNYSRNDLTGNEGFVFGQSDIHGGATTNPTNHTNLRAAVVSIQDENGRLLTRLYGYAANIGEYQAYSRVRP